MKELPSVGDQVGGYTVGELLGQGGCAAVFRATKGEQQVALKVVLPSFLVRQADVGPRFLREVNVTFRRDPYTGRARANKPESSLDVEQREKGEYFYLE